MSSLESLSSSIGSGFFIFRTIFSESDESDSSLSLISTTSFCGGVDIVIRDYGNQNGDALF